VASIEYDRAASEYAAHRRIHGGVFRALVEQQPPRSSSAVLEVGCGTGNYIGALSSRADCIAYGLDPSAGMLAQARIRPEPVRWLRGRAEHLPFAGDAFDLLFSVDVIHHVADKGAFYREAERTLCPGGWVCTVTDSAEIIRRREILSGYFPETVEIELARYPRVARLESWMVESGLVDLEVLTVEEPFQLTSARAFRDRAYSSLYLIPEDAWRAGLERLEHDLARGPLRGASRYVCIWGCKRKR
jgi:ubiquinone/menaquinone biosynthesis C-methylase UbiE